MKQMNPHTLFLKPKIEEEKLETKRYWEWEIKYNNLRVL